MAATMQGRGPQGSSEALSLPPNNLGAAGGPPFTTNSAQAPPGQGLPTPTGPPALNGVREHAHRFWGSPESTLGTTSEDPTGTTGSVSACRGNRSV